MKAKINEIFSSIQGEGPVVGYKQLFVRFCGCNLKCSYCDTDFADGKIYTPKELYNEITENYDLNTFHSISLTGGEPLMHIDFLSEFLPMIKSNVKIYLETNATLSDNFAKIREYVDIVSADIKINSSSGMNTIFINRQFFKECSGVETFVKIVFDENITNSEIEDCAKCCKLYDLELVLQPKMVETGMSVSSEFCNKILDKFTQIYSKVRLVPQVHKFLNVR